MIEFYALQIIMGKITIDKVPEKYREAVSERVKTRMGES